MPRHKKAAADFHGETYGVAPRHFLRATPLRFSVKIRGCFGNRYFEPGLGVSLIAPDASRALSTAMTSANGSGVNSPDRKSRT